MNRKERIRIDLDSAQSDGAVRSWHAYAPGDGWQRWIVEVPGFGTRTFTTREVEAFLTGVQSATVNQEGA